MQRTIASATGAFLIAAMAIAAADIPTRYVGPFPPLGRLQNITGVFAGTTLTLKGTFINGTRLTSVTGNFTGCARVSPNQTRCRGLFESDDGQLALRKPLLVTWANGVPVKLQH
jgi:hypothetical protein